MRKLVRRLAGKGLMAVSAASALTGSAFAQSNVETIVTSASTTFTAVATLCVTIGTFMIGYKLARKVK